MGDRLRDVYEADLTAPLPDQLTELMGLLADAASEPASRPVATAESATSVSPPA